LRTRPLRQTRSANQNTFHWFDLNLSTQSDRSTKKLDRRLLNCLNTHFTSCRYPGLSSLLGSRRLASRFPRRRPRRHPLPAIRRQRLTNIRPPESSPRPKASSHDTCFSKQDVSHQSLQPTCFHWHPLDRSIPERHSLRCTNRSICARTFDSAPSYGGRCAPFRTDTE